MGMLIIILSVVALTAASHDHKNPHFAEGRSVIVQMFEWKWTDIAEECEKFFGPKGYGGLQVSPPNENVVMKSSKRPWAERYQPLSYVLVTRSGNEKEFTDMVHRCNAVGVRIYVDTLINNMAAELSENVGTAGNTADFKKYSYPAVPYVSSDFHQQCSIKSSDYKKNAKHVRNCELYGLKDLDHSKENVKKIIANYMNHLSSIGVAGFRIDAAKHMWPKHLGLMYDKLKALNTTQGFPANAYPYVYQEVVDYGGEAIKREEYTPLAAVSDFKVGVELSKAFKGNNSLKWLVNWGPEWALLNHTDALTFIENHDIERSSGGVLTYKHPKAYRAAIAFMLAHPYGNPRIMSSYAFSNKDVGPPMDANENIVSPTIFTNNTCGGGWVCQHRWRPIYAMVGFRNAANNTNVTEWWDNGGNQIAFCRGNNSFVAFNIESTGLNQTLHTCLPAGTYCDVISGDKVNNKCEGKSVKVGKDGKAHISIAPNDDDYMLAIHVGNESRIIEKKTPKATETQSKSKKKKYSNGIVGWFKGILSSIFSL